MIIIGGAKAGYNLHLLFNKNNISSNLYYFNGEYAEKKEAAKPIENLKPWRAIDEIIVSSERAFFYFRKELELKFRQHYFLRDKENISAIARALHVSTIHEVPIEQMVYPAFVKPKQSGEGKTPFKTRFIKNKNHLDRISAYLDDCTVQKFLDPVEYHQISIAGFFMGACDSLISVKQLNQYPLGVSSYVTFYVDEQIESLKKRVTDYLNTSSFRGFIELEFKISITGNQIYLMDVNPRLWGWCYYYLSAVKNLEDLVIHQEVPIIALKKSWVNLPRLALSNIRGNFTNPAVSEIVSNKICYEPFA